MLDVQLGSKWILRGLQGVGVALCVGFVSLYQVEAEVPEARKDVALTAYCQPEHSVKIPSQVNIRFEFQQALSGLLQIYASAESPAVASGDPSSFPMIEISSLSRTSGRYRALFDGFPITLKTACLSRQGRAALRNQYSTMSAKVLRTEGGQNFDFFSNHAVAREALKVSPRSNQSQPDTSSKLVVDKALMDLEGASKVRFGHNTTHPYFYIIERDLSMAALSRPLNSLWQYEFMVEEGSN